MEARQAYLYNFTENGRIDSDRQCEYVRALAFGLLEEEQSREAARILGIMIQRIMHRPVLADAVPGLPHSGGSLLHGILKARGRPTGLKAASMPCAEVLKEEKKG